MDGDPGNSADRRGASTIGTILLAGGLLVLALFVGFMVAMVAAIALASLLPIDPDGRDVAPGILQSAVVYLVWGATAAFTFAICWRRLRAPDHDRA